MILQSRGVLQDGINVCARRSKRVVQNVSFKTDWLNQQAAISIGATGVPKIAAGAKTKAAESGL